MPKTSSSSSCSFGISLDYFLVFIDLHSFSSNLHNIIMIHSSIQAAYHAAIMGNPDVFKDKVVMDVGTGSGILAGEGGFFLRQSFLYLIFTPYPT
jgi:hypothetical protein